MGDLIEMKVTVDDTVLKALPARTDRVIALFLDAEAEQTTNDIKLRIQEVSLGKVYARPHGKVHIASRPGDPPNVDLGYLINSYIWKPKGPFTRLITTDAEYAPQLEFGEAERNLAPRPHVGPAMERLRKRLLRDAQKFRIVR